MFAAIEVVSETTAEELAAAEGDQPELTKGVRVAYTTPAPKEVSSPVLSALAEHARFVSMHHFSEGGNSLAREVMNLVGACLGSVGKTALLA